MKIIAAKSGTSEHVSNLVADSRGLLRTQIYDLQLSTIVHKLLERKTNVNLFISLYFFVLLQ